MRPIFCAFFEHGFARVLNAQVIFTSHQFTLRDFNVTLCSLYLGKRGDVGARDSGCTIA